MIVRALLFLVLISGAFVSTASAQDSGQVGLFAASPGSIGVHWQVSDRWAVRADGSYTYSKSVSDSGDGSDFSFTSFTPTVIGMNLSPMIATHTESRTHTATIGLSAVITVHRRDALRLYVAPRVSMALAKLTAEMTTEILNLPPGFTANILGDLRRPRSFEDSSRTPAFGASFGASTTIGDRFGVFSEVGFNYSHSDSPLTSSVPIDITRTAIGTRAAVGAMLIF